MIDMILSFLIVGLLIALVVKFFHSILNRTKNTKNLKEKKQKQVEETGLLHKANLALVSGINLPEDTSCELRYYSDHIEILASGNQFNLSLSKITDICFKTDVDVQEQYVSSAGGAVAGAMIAGPVGAIIGGRAKKKKTRDFTTYFIITYNKDSNVDYIIFEATFALKQCGKFIDEFRKNKPQVNAPIEL